MRLIIIPMKSLASTRAPCDSSSRDVAKSRHFFGTIARICLPGRGLARRFPARWAISCLASLLAAATLLTAQLQAAYAADPAGQPRAPIADTMAQRMQACTPCHGAEGRAARDGYYPRIAGKPAGYLYEQLRSFRDGRRNQAAMSHLLGHLSDDYLAEMAQYFADLDLPYPPATAPSAGTSLLARGEMLVRRGDPAADLPSCTACHGDAMTGREPGTPGLLGLPRDYLVAQIGAWQAHQRRGIEPDCMADIARRLKPDDVLAVTSWLASRCPATQRPSLMTAAPCP